MAARKRKLCSPGECGRLDWEARITLLEQAIRKHRYDVWGSDEHFVESCHDRDLYAVLHEAAENSELSPRDLATAMASIGVKGE